jgi:energy-converting hydrogenase Eha subunit F
MADEKVDFSLKDISPNIGANKITGNGGNRTMTDFIEINFFLFVKIVRARNLFAHYGHYNFDPYVEVKAGSFRGRTLCFRRNSNPEWNQVFALDNDQIQTEEIATVEILVKDNVRKHDEYMSKISLDISDISTRFPTDSELAPQWCLLEDRRGRRFNGELMMSCWIGSQADESFHEALHLQLDNIPIGAHHVINTCSRIYIMPRIWCLRLNLVQVEGLIVRVDDPSESSDIFIHASLGTWSFTTKLAKSNNGNPTWDENDVFFAVPEPFNQILVLSVEQGTLTRHKCLGRCEFPVKNADMIFDGSGPPTKTVDVIQIQGFVGKLSMRISLDGGYHMFDDDPRYCSDWNPTFPMLWRPTIGVFEMGIVKATGLPAMKPHGRTDAYCVAKYGSKWVRSRTVVNSLSPKWNEKYSWDVYDQCTFITICVFDNNQLHEGNIAAEAMDTRIGKVRICLQEMEMDKVYEYSYPLLELQPSGLKKMGEIQLAFKFTCPDMLNVCKMYTMPMLPSQHYSDPLSPAQFYGLRKQIIMLVSSNMRKAEPPLRREVIDYMLDSRENMWSMRRCRADFERIDAFVRWLLGIYTQFDEICKWKDQTKTIIVGVVLLFFIFNPQLLLPAMFVCPIMHVLLQLPHKPKRLSHVDLQLSHVHTASVDELEEEFDPIPSKFEDIILRNRYDRLRVAAGRHVTWMGELATKIERLQSLLSWHDEISTMLVMIMCLITGIVTSAVPFQYLVFFWSVYLLRHPMVRSPFPPFYENWVRRMPSKLDSMI